MCKLQITKYKIFLRFNFYIKNSDCWEKNKNAEVGKFNFNFKNMKAVIYHWNWRTGLQPTLVGVFSVYIQVPLEEVDKDTSQPGRPSPTIYWTCKHINWLDSTFQRSKLLNGVSLILNAWSRYPMWVLYNLNAWYLN